MIITDTDHFLHFFRQCLYCIFFWGLLLHTVDSRSHSSQPEACSHSCLPRLRCQVLIT